jgi:adenosine deaminase
VQASPHESPFHPAEPLAELHAHLGGSVPPHVLWEIAHDQGIALPTKDYWEFCDRTTIADPRGVEGLAGLDQIYHLTELIQSSPLAVERSVHGMIGGGYRSQRITTSEVRFNPMKRNRGGERDLDHIVMAAVRGLDRASLEYPQVRAGLILMMDRTFGLDLNGIIVDRALRYAPRGVVGIDIAGPRPGPGRYAYADLAPLVEEARAGGLGVTIHVGEEGYPDEIGEVVEHLRPQRIGHGILAVRDPELMALLARTETVLELCPTSNILTGAVSGADEVREIFRTLRAHGVRITVSTDGPEMMRTHLRDEFGFLCAIGALTPDEAREANALAHAVSFALVQGRRNVAGVERG